jgi:signal transduction histidine kinase/CheY-like chemotaxis protein
VSNDAQNDPRLMQEVVARTGVSSLVLVPMLSEGHILGLLVACNKPGGFTDDDIQILTIFAGPAATFLRSRQIFERERQHSSRLERLSGLVGQMAAVRGRSRLLGLVTSRIREEMGCLSVGFHAVDEREGLVLESESGPDGPPSREHDTALLHYALRSLTPLRPSPEGALSQLAVPVRAGDLVLGVLDVARRSSLPFDDDEVTLFSTLASQLALALQRAESDAATERMARQMVTLYDLGLETAALRDLRALFASAAEEAGRLIEADRTSVFRFDEREGVLRLFAAWDRDPARRQEVEPTVGLDDGIIGRVARDRLAALENEPGPGEGEGAGAPRTLCVPLTFYDRQSQAPALFGVLAATREARGPRFATDDLEYLTRFASQLAIAVTNSFAFQSERERSEQLALVNTLVREIAGKLSRESIYEATVRRIHDAFRYHGVSIVVPDPEAGVFRVAALASGEPRMPEWGAFPLNRGICGRCLRTRSTQVVADVTADPDFVRWSAATRSEVAIPIVSAGEVVALLDIESSAMRAFDQGQVITLETIADSVGIIVRNAELFKALEETNARLVELDRMKSELVHIVAHDFRAPLSSILGYAELLEWKPDAAREERLDRTRAIVRAATQMASLMDKTLTTARLETGHLSFDFGIVNLVDLAREAAARFPREEGHPLTVEEPDYPLPAWADPARVAEVLDNLLSNAVKYSPRGGPVVLRVDRERETAVFSVIDQGIGIAQKDRDLLFRPFSRVRDSETAAIDGFGLGLHICERVARAHGGRLGVESEPGRGSTFRFELPLYGAAAQSHTPLLLVAARDAATRREIRRVAEAMGFSTHEVTDGLEALEAVVRLVPSVVVVDRVLPHLRGDEIAERLSGRETTRGIPIVALAAAEDLGPTAARFSACVPKPVDPLVLEACLLNVRGRGSLAAAGLTAPS